MKEHSTATVNVSETDDTDTTGSATSEEVDSIGRATTKIDIERHEGGENSALITAS